ncbi:DNA processing protein [Pelomonas saccharophila]|uniref:DNA processing protein n=1 Tax=Roseateles saccharophilus TaxID=304 RepID=A0ABU1YW97_ROSSA|nr:DNA-processing protein DprA [Roseateles saccharophilus]MDR7273135.1 DNA processing protein [Roseateles saccharophilus]
MKGSYLPPSVWEEISVRKLLAASRRGIPTKTQLELLKPARRTADGDVRVFAAGDASLVARPCVSVIGTRKVSDDGAARAKRLSRELVACGVVIVSGLAEGVDTEAMSSTIQHGGKTIGVIGTPLDKAYPAKNKRLQEEIYQEHLLISQFEFGARVFPSNFPARNRLMALLSDATVVIEASDTSGTLHQAAECVRLGRWLFIAKSVVADPTIEWPSRFLGYEKCRQLERTEDIMSAVYPS